MLQEANIPAFPEVGTEEGRDSMEAAGLVACTPPVRSSDFDLVCRAPFCYFLSRRLGLVKSLRWTKALSRGSWFHEAFKHSRLSPQQRREKVELSLEIRQEELSGVCSQLGVSAEGRREILSRERQDADVSLAWFEAAMDSPISDEYGTARDFFSRPYWREISRECRLVRTVPMQGKQSLQCVAQPDLLLYHSGQNSVWIVDAKTTSVSPALRATSCPYEFQSRHYMHIARYLIQRGLMQRVFDLPSDVRLGGIIHLIVRKPTIEFGMKDRNFTVDTTPFKSGPRKGLPKNEKVYSGEPVWENYLDRVRQWYRAEDEYTHLRPEWDMDPPVNMSIVSSNLIDEQHDLVQYMAQLDLIRQWAFHKPNPYEFPMPSGLVSFNRLDDYAPFIMNPPSAWPEVIRQEGWMQVRRDDLPHDILDDVVPEPGSEFD